MSLFKRISTVFSSQAHSAVDKLEDPVKMTEQGIRDLKKDLRTAMEALAETKALAVKLKKDRDAAQNRAEKFASDARRLLQQGQSGKLEEGKADELARKALAEKRKAEQRAQELEPSYQNQSKQVEQLQDRVGKLKRNIEQYESELVTLRARSKAATASRKINQQLAKTGEDDTISMLERMKENVEREENLALAYGEMADEGESVDAEIDRALAGAEEEDADDELARLKAELSS